jgi:hypothetical protein
MIRRLVLVLMVCVASAQALGETEADARRAHLTINMRDGSRLWGRIGPLRAVLRTPYASMDLQLVDFEHITFKSGPSDVSAVMRNGDVLGGGLDLDAITIDTLIGAITVPAAAISEMAVIPPITIAGAEDFDWRIRMTNCEGWDFTNDDGILSVLETEPARTDTGTAVPWATVGMSHVLEKCHDFSLALEFAWDGPGPQAMQCLTVDLGGPEGRVACVSHHDAWVASRGSRDSYIEDKREASGHNTQPVSGSATIAVSRCDGETRILWNGKLVRSGTSGRPLSRIDLYLKFYPHERPGQKSVFGSLTVRRLELTTP